MYVQAILFNYFQIMMIILVFRYWKDGHFLNFDFATNRHGNQRVPGVDPRTNP